MKIRYLSHVFPLPQVAVSKAPREGIDSSASLLPIMVGGKGKINCELIKNIENEKRAMIVKCFVKDTVLSLSDDLSCSSKTKLYFDMFYKLVVCFAKTYFNPFRCPH